MKISKERLREIVAEELKLALQENQKGFSDEICQQITSFINEAKLKDKNIVNSPKLKKLIEILGE